MFDVGFAELFVLALIGLLVLGPERLPRVARTVGGFVRKARASWISLRNTIQSELDAADISAPIKQAEKEFKQIGKDLSDLADVKIGETPSTTANAATEAGDEKPPTRQSTTSDSDA